MKIVYITPEKYSRSDAFRNAMRRSHDKGVLRRVVIDEAHCVSEWGHDFRPDYKALSNLKTQLPGINIMALTATATKRVQMDISHLLQIKDCCRFQQSFNRDNLRYKVKKKQKNKVGSWMMTIMMIMAVVVMIMIMIMIIMALHSRPMRNHAASQNRHEYAH